MSIIKLICKCNIGDHDLIEISRISRRDNDEVTRWCRTCGSIVVDIEVDGRLVKPGGCLKMLGPKILKY